jgi:hypothetical protein
LWRIVYASSQPRPYFKLRCDFSTKTLLIRLTGALVHNPDSKPGGETDSTLSEKIKQLTRILLQSSFLLNEIIIY